VPIAPVEDGMGAAIVRAMALWLRILLWGVVVLVPGGAVLLPILARDALQRRARLLPSLAQGQH
jgi:hypothetical protein